MVPCGPTGLTFRFLTRIRRRVKVKQVRANLLFTLSSVFVWFLGIVGEVVDEVCNLPVVHVEEIKARLRIERMKVKKVRTNCWFTLSWIFVWLPGVILGEVAGEVSSFPDVHMQQRVVDDA